MVAALVCLFTALPFWLLAVFKVADITRQRLPSDERRVFIDLTSKWVSLRKRTEQMLGEFYCFLNVPLAELFDLKDRLRHFVSSAGPREIKTTPVKLSEPA